MIEQKITEIIEKNEKSIIVLIGFETTELTKEDKYFSFEIEYYDKINLQEYQNQVRKEVIKNLQFEQNYKWMTIEEYQLFKEFSKINEIPVIALENNLYDKQFPYQNTLSDIENIYNVLYYQEDNELSADQEELLNNISYFYGQIDYSKQSNQYYVTYPEFQEEIEKFQIYPNDNIEVNFEKNAPTENAQRIELSDDELPFLDLETRILSGTSMQNIVFILSSASDEFPNHYLARLKNLKELSKINIFFELLSMRRKNIGNEQKYLEILKKVYGYDNFRELDFYKNIENRTKEILKISQAQIIDDIVIQTENAMNEEDFRDVYITASTGAGKSVMFQIPALYLAEKYSKNKPLTLVISPLIGLMNDQVDNMNRKGIRTTATINGNTPPFEKEKILERVQSQEIDVLYLSPETLQARSDIKMLIGERKIGVVIIDEAHIVTTWGKSFRADYWYLGIYLAKIRKEYKFPIVTFTATAIYGGKEDMYLDTRNSLNMIRPISYFGAVRRDDLLMNVRSSDKDLATEGKDYRKTKNTLALKHLQMATKKNQKSLLYFPTVKLLIEFYNFVKENEPEIAKKTGKYYGSLQKEEKDEVLKEYKSGELQFVLATKAFGMGIDIPDITNVYHYAPTGNVVDYVQEIGRAARDKTKVPYGFGMIDFLSRDMNEVKQLQGMSSIRKNQILEVMKKVLSVYKEKGNNRNLLISPEDFKYIFVQNKRDEDSLDNKVKTVLLMIEKDFSSPNKLGYSPFVARPRSLFGNDLIFATHELEKELEISELRSYFSKKYDLNETNYSAIYQVDLSKIWEKYYKNMSFPSFKYSLFNQEEREKLTHKKLFEKLIFTSGVEVTLNNNGSIGNLLSEYRKILNAFEKFLKRYKMSGEQFTIMDLGNHFMTELKIVDKFEARAFAQTIINAAFEFSKLKEIKFIVERSNSNAESQRYIIHQEGDLFTEFVMDSLKHAINPNDNYVKNNDSTISFHFRTKNGKIDEKLAALGIGEARKLLNFQVIGGNNPQLYLRMNSIYPLERAIKQGDFYENSILKDVQNKHYISVEMLKYLFTKEQNEENHKERIVNYSKWFWYNIENYFMGVLPNEVKETILKNHSEKSDR